jgi:hypothetical protein
VNIGFTELGSEGMKVGDAVLAVNIHPDERSLEIAEGARSRGELWKSFPKHSEVWIYKERGVELHLLMILQKVCSCEEPLELRKVPVDL